MGDILRQAYCEAGSAATGWWNGAVGYEIYVRSFADSNGDGVGDLEGIRRRLDYLKWLGVDVIWITPFYPTPSHDHGYDVREYCDVSAMHGNIADFDVLVEQAHDLGLRVIIDIVPNHSSIEHEWFKQARSGRGHPGRDRYVWADPAPGGGPPNNWRSHFGGPAWTLDEASGQYWCHLFLPEQPDLNWRNAEVKLEFERILRWWLDRGVDGFRIDVAHSLVKDRQLRDNPQIRSFAQNGDPFDAFGAFEHRHDLHQPETLDIFRRWRRICASRGAVLVGEVSVESPERMAQYVAPGVLDRAFFLTPAWTGWVPAELLQMARSMHEAVPDEVAWVLSNHDQQRAAGRFGGGETGTERALAVTVLFMSLGGMPFLYQGEELGLSDGVVSGAYDPVAARNAGAARGRDGCRTPMPWDSTANNGFTDGVPWIDSRARPLAETVEGQLADPGAPVHHYRELLSIRRRHNDLWQASATWLDTGDPLVALIRRGSVAIVANLSDRPATVTLPEPGFEPVFSSRRGDEPVRVSQQAVSVAAETSVILAAAAHPHS